MTLSVQANHEAHRTRARAYLKAHSLTRSLDAFDFASIHHTGTRKDKVTPEFEHQLCVLSFLQSIAPLLDNPPLAYTASLLHDTCEDKDVTYETIAERFGPETVHVVRLLTKEYQGQKLKTGDYYEALATDATASIVKASDRLHNLQSMIGVFTPERQQAYIEETRTYVLPMLEAAAKRFPSQAEAYARAMHAIKRQVAKAEQGLSQKSATRS